MDEARPRLFRGVRLIDPAAGVDRIADVLVRPGEVSIDPASWADAVLVEGHGLWALPGLIDLQVHFREPGFEHKETIATGSAAAFAGGVTAVVVMPNTKPTLDTPERVRFEREQAERVRGVDLFVAAAVTEGLAGEKLTDHGALRAAGAVAVTDDGLPVLDDALVRASMRACVEHDLLFMQHAEDTRLTRHAPMTEGPTSRALGVAGQPADAEGVVVERDVALAVELGARYHVLHTSTARSLRAVAEAKARGARVSCEASPHHLWLTDEACAGGDPAFKMNPPLRAEADRRALVEAVRDGTVDAVATDHAPHAAEEKALGFEKAPFGVVGLETAFAAVLELMHAGVVDARRAVELMTSGPARVLGHEGRLGTLHGEGAPAHLVVVDPEATWVVGPESLRGRSTNSAFLGRTFRGKVRATFHRGLLRYDDGALALG